jgi:hypothetical protein
MSVLGVNVAAAELISRINGSLNLNLLLIATARALARVKLCPLRRLTFGGIFPQ